MKAAPGISGKKLTRDSHVDERGSSRKYNGDQSFQQKADSDKHRQQHGPQARFWFSRFERAQKAPHGHRNRQRECRIWNQNPREAEKTNRRTQDQTRVKTATGSEGPFAEPERYPAQRDNHQSQRQP